jgi:hypothetical protein
MEIVGITLSVLGLIVALPGAIQSLVWLKERFGKKK